MAARCSAVTLPWCDLVYGCTCLQQLLHHLQMASDSCMVQRSVALKELIHCHATLLQQQLNYIAMPCCSCVMQQRPQLQVHLLQFKYRCHNQPGDSGMAHAFCCSDTTRQMSHQAGAAVALVLLPLLLMMLQQQLQHALLSRHARCM
jgi:hypothetical protein